MTETFAVCGGLAVLFAAAALFQKTLYGAAMCLLGVLLETAVLFILLGSPLLGFLQVLVYAGAVMVLVVIAILASPPKLSGRWAELNVPRPVAWLAPLAAFAGLMAAGQSLGGVHALPQAGPALERAMARLLFGPWALATEAVGVLVLIASLSVLKEDA
ncbi:MAG: NADH-quinone oxidoreductase subunit J [Elusimicrobia bacterium]|nr:NADH-quinone oxidoreductase subunit J [Elusimicrobiota bacterium]